MITVILLNQIIEPLEFICDKINVPPANSLIVGDTELDINCGKNASAITCGVTYGYRSLEKLKLTERINQYGKDITQLKELYMQIVSEKTGLHRENQILLRKIENKREKLSYTQE